MSLNKNIAKENFPLTEEVIDVTSNFSIFPDRELKIQYYAKFKDNLQSELYDVWNLAIDKGQRINILDLETGKTVLVDKKYVNHFGVLQSEVS